MKYAKATFASLQRMTGSMQFIDLESQQTRIKEKLDTRIQAVLAHGKYILGPEVQELETALSEFCGSEHTITCANGTDALQLALMVLNVGKGDAVFVPSFTFAATAEVVPFLGATPVFVDIDPITFNMSADSLKRSILHARDLGLNPAVVIPVDLFGMAADYDTLIAIAREEDMKVIADCAQGFGATYKGRSTGTLADVTTVSFFPAKPLGCYGDGGALFTDNDEWAELLESYRFHGKGSEKYDNVRIGMNSRLDTIQAAILLEKLAIYPDEIEKRNSVARRYSDSLQYFLETPVIPGGFTSVWAQYVLKARDAEHRNSKMTQLKEAGIPTMVYYPIPLSEQTAYKHFPGDPEGCKVAENLARRVFSLPMHAYLGVNDQDRIVQALGANTMQPV
ncbi:MAG: DegT/DnrJ/EryC1/StrS family aminotransferase [Hyphomicrobiales bacterium]